MLSTSNWIALVKQNYILKCGELNALHQRESTRAQANEHTFNFCVSNNNRQKDERFMFTIIGANCCLIPVWMPKMKLNLIVRSHWIKYFIDNLCIFWCHSGIRFIFFFELTLIVIRLPHPWWFFSVNRESHEKKRIFQYIECSKWQTVVNVVAKSKIPLDNDIYMLRAIILNWLISSKVFAGMWNIYPLSLLLLSQVFYLIKRKNEDFFLFIEFCLKNV